MLKQLGVLLFYPSIHPFIHPSIHSSIHPSMHVFIKQTQNSFSAGQILYKALGCKKDCLHQPSQGQQAE